MTILTEQLMQSNHNNVDKSIIDVASGILNEKYNKEEIKETSDELQLLKLINSLYR